MWEQLLRDGSHASCLMPHASCLMPHASCLMPHASCLMPYPQRHTKRCFHLFWPMTSKAHGRRHHHRCCTRINNRKPQKQRQHVTFSMEQTEKYNRLHPRLLSTHASYMPHTVKIITQHHITGYPESKTSSTGHTHTEEHACSMFLVHIYAHSTNTQTHTHTHTGVHIHTHTNMLRICTNALRPFLRIPTHELPCFTDIATWKSLLTTSTLLLDYRILTQNQKVKPSCKEPITKLHFKTSLQTQTPGLSSEAHPSTPAK
jgi:hypothetical protein